MSKSLLSVSFFRIIELIIMNILNIIVWPHREELSRKKKLFFHMAVILNAIGVIYGTHIPIKAPKK